MKTKVIIVPHTHWDREWYLPFQRFRMKLVNLIDELLNILDNHEYSFMLDGQTILIEDYLEIRPEKREELLKRIQEGKISVGPWYLLPDEWLVGAESLVRNLEYSQSLAKRLKIPLMDIAYLPDQFGHSSAIPQILHDITNLRTTTLWRGVPSDIKTVPFSWKSHSSSNASIRGIYLPGGYGNFAILPEDFDSFANLVNDNVDELEPFSPVPVYLLMNGSDHRFPQSYAIDYVDSMKKDGFDISIGSLREYAYYLEQAIVQEKHTPLIYEGEFRSPARAPLLQDTYSARMWIKVWNQKVEDLLTMRVEPISSYLWFCLDIEYPRGFLETAWKWLLKNHPHDSICGCSVDQTHDEMRSRFSWAESVGESVIDDSISKIQKSATPSKTSSLIVFNASGTMRNPVYFEFSYPKEKKVSGIKTQDGTIFEVQPVTSKEDIFMEATVGLTMAKMGMRLLPGRKLMDFYINDVEYYEGDEPGLLELRFISDRHPIGEFDMDEFKREARKMIESKRYKKVHLVASRPTQNVYATLIPLQPWTFTQLDPVEKDPDVIVDAVFEVEKNKAANRFYIVSFNKDGSMKLKNKETGLTYDRLHVFEDFGDRGDEYTFSRVEPEKAKPTQVKRDLIAIGPIFAEIRQTMSLEIFESIDASREKRVGTVAIPVESIFRFYRDSPRIEVTTRITNRAKDHRLRVCFDLPFTTDKTITSTHFGCVHRDSNPETIPDEDELERTKSTFPEMPSGIQPQKQFIRIEEEAGNNAITALNKGLPEVELVGGKRLAITLVRSVGWLSRSDFPERPIHAGPPEETPAAQEMNTEYEFNYAFLTHTRDAPLHMSADQADAFSDDATVISFDEASAPSSISTPIIQIDNPSVRVSSLRVRNNSLLVTMYNLENRETSTDIKLSSKISTASEVRIDGSEKEKIRISGNSASLNFEPREIKMCMFQKD
ncbi:MAG: glycoside hydrolase family 38 C-terminal domain-containing protein [Candidatus Thorarchaeota archaeon]|jgi:alpha-mannosidase